VCPLPPRGHVHVHRAALVKGAQWSEGELLAWLAVGLVVVFLGTKVVKGCVSQLGWNQWVASTALGAAGWLA